VRDTIGELGLDGIVQGQGWLEVSKFDDREAAHGRARLLAEEFGVEAEPWSLEQVRDVLRTDHYFGAVHYPNAFQINPLAYCLALADAVERAGVFVFENTPALTIDAAGVRKRVDTPDGRVRAGRVVLAGNVHLGDVSKKVAGTLVPVIAYTAVTKPLGSRLESIISYAGMVSDSRYGNYTYRVIDGDRLMWTGGVSIRERSTRGMARRLARAIRTTYPDLGPVAFEDFWWGSMGFAVHRMPQIGEVQPGLWLASGFGGHGINTSAIAGKLIARAMVEGDTTWETFLPYELVWAGGKAGRALIQALLSWRHASEAVAANLARRREALRYKREREAAGEAPLDFVRRPAYRIIKAVRRPERQRGPNDAPIGAPGARPHTRGPAQMRDSEEKV
jgi:gamma-glutamylputrescine oxidase